MNDQLIQSAREYIKELFLGNSDGHDLNHSLRVYANAMTIAETEPSCDIETVALAALLHDADRLDAMGAIEMAAPRHAFLEEFMERFEEEIGIGRRPQG